MCKRSRIRRSVFLCLVRQVDILWLVTCHDVPRFVASPSSTFALEVDPSGCSSSPILSFIEYGFAWNFHALYDSSFTPSWILYLHVPSHFLHDCFEASSFELSFHSLCQKPIGTGWYGPFVARRLMTPEGYIPIILPILFSQVSQISQVSSHGCPQPWMGSLILQVAWSQRSLGFAAFRKRTDWTWGPPSSPVWWLEKPTAGPGSSSIFCYKLGYYMQYCIYIIIYNDIYKSTYGWYVYIYISLWIYIYGNSLHCYIC